MNDIKSGYAKALFDLASETNHLKLYLKQVKILEKLYDDQLANFLNTFSIAKEVKKELIDDSLKGFEPYLINFLKIIIDRKLTTHLKEIIDAFKKLAFQSLNIGILKIYSAKKINQQHLDLILDSLKDKEYRVINIIDAKLLAGYKLVIDDKKVIDVSLSKQLKDLKDELIKEGY